MERNSDILRPFRRRIIQDSFPWQGRYGRDIVCRLIPHREPFLLIDAVTGLDLAAGTIRGERVVSPDDPVFKGHFPGYPVYPGALEIEMTGQLGLCLVYFLTSGTTDPPSGAKNLNLRATKVLGAFYLDEVRPGDTVTLYAKKIEDDGMTAVMVGQTVVGGRICAVTAGEVLFLD